MGHSSCEPAGAARPLRIGVDGTCLGSGRGYGRFLRELLPALLADPGPHAWQLFVDEITAETAALPDMPVVRLHTGESQARAASARGRRGLADLRRMGRGVAAQPLDVFWFPSLYSYFPVPGRLPVAVTIHDTIPERHGAIVFPSRATRAAWRVKSWLARRRARTLLTVSEYARRSLVDVFGIPSERIHVTPEAPSPAFGPVSDPEPGRRWRERQGIPPEDPFLIYVGGFNPHKNVRELVRAFAALHALGYAGRLRLLLVGDHAGDVFHGEVAAIRAEIEARGVADRVHWTGFVPDDALRRQYAAARACVLPSLEEGFGLPAVEAAACGAPCVATRESPLPEVLEGGGLFFDPQRPGALERALGTLLRDPALRDELGETARKRAAALSWSATARATRRALERTAEAPA